jgi:hypothetical protein
MHRSDQVAEGLGGRRDDLDGALDLDLPGEPIEQPADLLGDQRPAAGSVTWARSTSLSYCFPAVSA